MANFVDTNIEDFEPLLGQILVRIPAAPRKIGSIELPDEFRDRKKHSNIVGIVHKLGPVAFAYSDGTQVLRAPVEVGDFVMFHPYSGTLAEEEGKFDMEQDNWRIIPSASIIAYKKPNGSSNA